ncbi:FxsA family protein [Candidatus Pelagibacter sp.]|nr:FxsA family protein [Candidatus Pelagibacter sp.]MDA9728019.1 FxsA family protein [Candidatus Pelagibacter sp.]
MNSLIILIIGIPLIEIYLFIKIGSQIGAFNTVLLIIITAIIGVAYVRYEGFNTLKSGIRQLIKNELPVYELVSGATLAFASLLLILPGFATDFIGILLVIPFTRKIILSRFIKTKNNKKNDDRKNYIDGDYEDLSDDNDKKI